MTDEIDRNEPEQSLSDWDCTAIVFFIVILLGVSIYYWFFWRDFWVPLVSIIGVLFLYNVTKNDTESMYKPIMRSWNPLIEIAIVLILLLIWLILVFPLIAPNLEGSILGSSIFEFLFPYLLLVTYFGYSRQSIGIELKRSETDGLVLTICSILIASRLLILLISPNGLTLLITNIGPLCIGILNLGFLVGFVEEFIFRGIIQNRLSLHFQSRIFGIILTASLFAIMHVMTVLAGVDFSPMNVGYSLIYAFMTRLPLGIILGMVWNDSENLIGVTMIHASNNIAFLLQSLTGL